MLFHYGLVLSTASAVTLSSLLTPLLFLFLPLLFLSSDDDDENDGDDGGDDGDYDGYDHLTIVVIWG